MVCYFVWFSTTLTFGVIDRRNPKVRVGWELEVIYWRDGVVGERPSRKIGNHQYLNEIRQLKVLGGREKWEEGSLASYHWQANAENLWEAPRRRSPSKSDACWRQPEKLRSPVRRPEPRGGRTTEIWRKEVGNDGGWVTRLGDLTNFVDSGSMYRKSGTVRINNYGLKT